MKTDLVSEISKRCEVTDTKAREFVDAFTEVVTEALGAGDSVRLTGFGSFEVAERAERSAINPKTGEKVSVAAHKVPKFRAGKILKDAVK